MNSEQQKRFTALETLSKEILENMPPQIVGGYRDYIEGVDIEADESGYFLVIEGDFTRECLRYQVNTDEDSPNYNKMTFKIYHSELKELVRQIHRNGPEYL
jgi:hypothetical protein